MRLRAALLLTPALICPAVAEAQMPMHHHAAAADSASHHAANATSHQHGASSHGSMTDMSGMDMGAMPMSGMYGPYAMSREASGTSWQPEAARHEGLHIMRGPWMLMLHGFADGVYDNQGGARGDTKFFSNNMGMAMAQRPLGPGSLGLRSMLSLEPATIGKDGYPLLLQTG